MLHLLPLLLHIIVSAADRELPRFPEMEDLRTDIPPFYVYDHEDCEFRRTRSTHSAFRPGLSQNPHSALKRIVRSC